ncbi:hypothetical protein [Luteimonas mephitis]|uniref:hypothetical protein n=1 Tax=Luteimonas mephitis TaxID=83615 RepID=UPI00040B0BFD|nr:hypothetical protein [Luteimonas mephitis]
MSTSFKPLGLAVALALAGCSQAAPSADTAELAPPADTAAEAPTTVADAAPAAEAAAVPAPQLQAAMRDLWHGHIVHARDYVIAVHAGNDADAKAAADAVVDNARQISGAVAGFYGQAGGDQMLTLLGGHWGAVKALTDARAAKDDAGATKAIDDLNANAAAIAKFLAGANPNLPEDTVHGLMLAHGAHHAQQINLILADDTAGEAQEWAAMQAHMDMIADALAAAIAKQFPDKAS